MWAERKHGDLSEVIVDDENRPPGGPTVFNMVRPCLGELARLERIRFWIAFELVKHCCDERNEIGILDAVPRDLRGDARVKPEVVRREVALGVSSAADRIGRRLRRWRRGGIGRRCVHCAERRLAERVRLRRLPWRRRPAR